MDTDRSAWTDTERLTWTVVTCWNRHIIVDCCNVLQQSFNLPWMLFVFRDRGDRRCDTLNPLPLGSRSSLYVRARTSGSSRGKDERVAFLKAEVNNLRSEMQTDAIKMGGFLFVSRVGTDDWVVKNQVSSSTTLYLDIVSILQVAYSNCTDQRTQLPRGLHCDRSLISIWLW
jgi:hypothetical protein